MHIHGQFDTTSRNAVLFVDGRARSTEMGVKRFTLANLWLSVPGHGLELPTWVLCMVVCEGAHTGRRPGRPGSENEKTELRDPPGKRSAEAFDVLRLHAFREARATRSDTAGASR